MDIKYDYIIYHQNCFDGFTGFYLFMKTKYWQKKPTVYPDQPHAKEVPPGIEGKNVIIIDVAYKPVILHEIAKKAKRVLFIDHHISIINEIKELKLQLTGESLEIFYDDKLSGASLVWKYFYKNKKMPKFVKYIEDNDIGRWALEDSVPFIAGLEVEYKTDPTHENLKKWDRLLNKKVLKELVERGRNYNMYKSYLIDKYKKKTNYMYFPSKKLVNMGLFDKEGVYKVAVINSNCPSVSLLGKRIAEEGDYDFVFLYIYDIYKRKYFVSLRSKKADVTDIAKRFGGGGHTLASAFSINRDEFNIDDLFNREKIVD